MDALQVEVMCLNANNEPLSDNFGSTIFSNYEWAQFQQSHAQHQIKVRHGIIKIH
jgi:hypothetical protein